MFSKEDILAQLREGADASDIAQKMADNINAAIQEYEAEQEKAKRDLTRREDARHMVSTMSDFFSKYMDEDPMDEADIDSATDAVMELLDSLAELKKTLGDANINVTVRKPEREPHVNRLDDDVIKAFLDTLK